MNTIAQLSDTEANAVLALVAKAWIKSGDPMAKHLLNMSANCTEEYLRPIDPRYPRIPTDRSVFGACSKLSLKILRNASDGKTRGWIEDSFEPRSLYETEVISLGLVLIGIILAARIQDVNKDGAKFYRGLPDGIVNFISKALTSLNATR